MGKGNRKGLKRILAVFQRQVIKKKKLIYFMTSGKMMQRERGSVRITGRVAIWPAIDEYSSFYRKS